MDGDEYSDASEYDMNYEDEDVEEKVGCNETENVKETVKKVTEENKEELEKEGDEYDMNYDDEQIESNEVKKLKGDQKTKDSLESTFSPLSNYPWEGSILTSTPHRTRTKQLRKVKSYSSIAANAYRRGKNINYNSKQTTTDILPVDVLDRPKAAASFALALERFGQWGLTTPDQSRQAESIKNNLLRVQEKKNRPRSIYSLGLEKRIVQQDPLDVLKSSGIFKTRSSKLRTQSAKQSRKFSETGKQGKKSGYALSIKDTFQNLGISTKSIDSEEKKEGFINHMKQFFQQAIKLNKQLDASCLDQKPDEILIEKKRNILLYGDQRKKPGQKTEVSAAKKVLHKTLKQTETKTADDKSSLSKSAKKVNKSKITKVKTVEKCMANGTKKKAEEEIPFIKPDSYAQKKNETLEQENKDDSGNSETTESKEAQGEPEEEIYEDEDYDISDEDYEVDNNDEAQEKNEMDEEESFDYSDEDDVVEEEEEEDKAESVNSPIEEESYSEDDTPEVQGSDSDGPERENSEKTVDDSDSDVTDMYDDDNEEVDDYYDYDDEPEEDERIEEANDQDDEYDNEDIEEDFEDDFEESHRTQT